MFFSFILKFHFPVTKIISSSPWTVEPKVKPTAAPKRKTSTTTTTTTTTTATKTTVRRTETTREVPERRTTLHFKKVAVTPMGKVENKVKELKWPYGGGGVTWIEVEGEQQQQRVKGSAVVEKEKVKEEVVTQPRTIFEEIFIFDK